MGMRIIQLEAQNVKRLKAVRIAPSGAVVEITGRNAQGKTSVLDSIMYALGGEKPIPSKPIRDGEKSARVRVDLGDETVELVVERTISESGSTLKVMSPDGAKFSKAQGKLNDLIGALTFDPLEFSRMEPKKQSETLRKLAGVDFSALDRERDDCYDRRRDVNRDAAAIVAQANGIRDYAPDDAEPVDVADLTEEIEKANRHNSQIEKMVVDADRKREDAATLRSAIEDRQKRIADMKRRISELSSECEQLAGDLKKVLDEEVEFRTAAASCHPMNVDALREKIRTAQDTNRAIEARDRRHKLLERAAEVEAESAKLTERIDAIDASKLDQLAQAKLPIDGLGLSDSGITYQGVPFDQCSSAEQLRVSVAMGLALNPKLRVMLIRDGSLLDEDSLRTVAEMADAADAQIWIETVAKGEPRGFVIEDGEVVTQ